MVTALGGLGRPDGRKTIVGDAGGSFTMSSFGIIAGFNRAMLTFSDSFPGNAIRKAS